MRTLIIATAAAVVVALWLFAPKVPTDISTASLALFSYWDAHNHAHLGGIPVQQFEDLSVVFTESGDKPAATAHVVKGTAQRP
jgi:hypothetical protein